MALWVAGLAWLNVEIWSNTGSRFWEPLGFLKGSPKKVILTNIVQNIAKIAKHCTHNFHLRTQLRLWFPAKA